MTGEYQLLPFRVSFDMVQVDCQSHLSVDLPKTNSIKIEKNKPMYHDMQLIYPHECAYPLGPSSTSPFHGLFSSPPFLDFFFLFFLFFLFTFTITKDGVYPSDIP